jgi:hypothetical protein
MSLAEILKRFPNLWNDDGTMRSEPISRQQRRLIKREAEKGYWERKKLEQSRLRQDTNPSFGNWDWRPPE